MKSVEIKKSNRTLVC